MFLQYFKSSAEAILLKEPPPAVKQHCWQICREFILSSVISLTERLWARFFLIQNHFISNNTMITGGGSFHNKGTWGCAAREGILFRTSSLAKGVLCGNFCRVKSRQGYAFCEFWSKRCQSSVIFVKKSNFFGILVQKMRKFGTFCLGNANLEHF